MQIAGLKLWKTPIVVENRLKKQIHLLNRLMKDVHQTPDQRRWPVVGGPVSVLARSSVWSMAF
ncbi:MAG TPA: hypothetical protein VEN30_30495 [Paraburkholderia sp.]|nr:hypothetical protein [Paraburkholderia sp.]